MDFDGFRSIRSIRSIRSLDGPRRLSRPLVPSRSLGLSSSSRVVECRVSSPSPSVHRGGGNDPGAGRRPRAFVDGRYRWSTTSVRASCGRGKKHPTHTHTSVLSLPRDDGSRLVVRGTQTAVSSCPPSLSHALRAWWSALIGYSTVSYVVQTYIQVLFVPIYVPVVVIVRVGPPGVRPGGGETSLREGARARDVHVVVHARVRVYVVVVDDGVVVQVFQGGDASAGVCDAARASRRGRRRVRVQGWDDAGVHGGWVVRAGDGDRRARGERRDAGTNSREFFFVCGRAWSRSRRCRSTRRWIHSFGVGDATRRRWARRRP